MWPHQGSVLSGWPWSSPSRSSRRPQPRTHCHPAAGRPQGDHGVGGRWFVSLMLSAVRRHVKSRQQKAPRLNASKNASLEFRFLTTLLVFLKSVPAKGPQAEPFHLFRNRPFTSPAVRLPRVPRASIPDVSVSTGNFLD